MASSKKTSPTKNKSPKSKAADSKIKDAVIVEGETSSDVAKDETVEVADAETPVVSSDMDQPLGDVTVETSDEIADEVEEDIKDVAEVAPEIVEPASAPIVMPPRTLP